MFYVINMLFDFDLYEELTDALSQMWLYFF